MCFQVVERYSVCRCLYYKHAIDPCAAHGQSGHAAQEKTVLVGEACGPHGGSHFGTDVHATTPAKKSRKTTKKFQPRADQIRGTVWPLTPHKEQRQSTSKDSGYRGAELVKHDTLLSKVNVSTDAVIENAGRPCIPMQSGKARNPSQTPDGKASTASLSQDTKHERRSLGRASNITRFEGQDISAATLGTHKDSLKAPNISKLIQSLSLQRTVAPGTSNSAQQNRNTESSRPTKETQQSHGNAPRKRCQGAEKDLNDGGDDSGDDEDDPRKKKKPKVADDPMLRRRLRCPFYLWDPKKYGHLQACSSGMGFEDMSRLKFHLKRVHTQPLRCPCCQAEMKSRSLLKEHLRSSERCEVLPEPDDDRISQEQWERIDSAKEYATSSKSVEEKYTQLYQALFGTAVDLPSPYERSFIMSELERLLVCALEEVFSQEFASIMPRIKEKIPEVIRICKAKLRDHTHEGSSLEMAASMSSVEQETGLFSNEKLGRAGDAVDRSLSGHLTPTQENGISSGYVSNLHFDRSMRHPRVTYPHNGNSGLSNLPIAQQPVLEYPGPTLANGLHRGGFDNPFSDSHQMPRNYNQGSTTEHFPFQLQSTPLHLSQTSSHSVSTSDHSSLQTFEPNSLDTELTPESSRTSVLEMTDKGGERAHARGFFCDAMEQGAALPVLAGLGSDNRERQTSDTDGLDGYFAFPDGLDTALADAFLADSETLAMDYNWNGG